MNTADEVLRLEFVSPDAPLEVARRWTRSGDETLKREAVKLLEGLRQSYPEVLEIDHELALALLECKEERKAEHVLEEIAGTHRDPSEEVLCRWGRIFKDRGDDYVDLTGEGQDKDPGSAVRFYRVALRYYEEAYAIRHGHYPGINIASLLLGIRAVTPSSGPLGEDTHRLRERESPAQWEKMARELLDRWDSWPRELPDDNIWHLATRADCHLLLKELDDATRLYEVALSEKNLQTFHVDCMQRQVTRVLGCFRRLELPRAGEEAEESFTARAVKELANAFPPSNPAEKE